MFESKNSYLTSRYEFERNFNILAELLLDGRMNFSHQSIRSVENLKKIRKLPNGRIDLNTINELARTVANMAGQFENFPKTDINHEKE
jgi:hypothetical protein